MTTQDHTNEPGPTAAGDATDDLAHAHDFARAICLDYAEQPNKAAVVDALFSVGHSREYAAAIIEQRNAAVAALRDASQSIATFVEAECSGHRFVATAALASATSKIDAALRLCGEEVPHVG